MSNSVNEADKRFGRGAAIGAGMPREIKLKRQEEVALEALEKKISIGRKAAEEKAAKKAKADA